MTFFVHVAQQTHNFREIFPFLFPSRRWTKIWQGRQNYRDVMFRKGTQIGFQEKEVPPGLEPGLRETSPVRIPCDDHYTMEPSYYTRWFNGMYIQLKRTYHQARHELHPGSIGLCLAIFFRHHHHLSFLSCYSGFSGTSLLVECCSTTFPPIP